MSSKLDRILRFTAPLIPVGRARRQRVAVFAVPRIRTIQHAAGQRRDSRIVGRVFSFVGHLQGFLPNHVLLQWNRRPRIERLPPARHVRVLRRAVRFPLSVLKRPDQFDCHFCFGLLARFGCRCDMRGSGCRQMASDFGSTR